MNQEVLTEIKERYHKIQTDYCACDITRREFVRAKISLYKDYMDYKEEFIDFMSGEHDCYIRHVSSGPCPDIACRACRKTHVFEVLLKNLNHAP